MIATELTKVELNVIYNCFTAVKAYRCRIMKESWKQQEAGRRAPRKPHALFRAFIVSLGDSKNVQRQEMWASMEDRK